MASNEWLRRLLPVTLAMAGLGLMIWVSLAGRDFVLSTSTGLLIFLLGLSLMIFTAMILIFREIMTRLSQQSIEHARDSAFAEHRRFLRRLDHELKNPLMALRAGLSSLAMTNPNSHQYQIIETLSAEAIRLSRLVVDLRKLAELEATALEIHAIDITAFLNELQELTRERLEGRGRQFHVECPAELTGSFTGDQDLLLLAIHNLLDNAIKYTQEGNTITLKIWSEDDDLVIQVEDTGRGILPDDIPLGRTVSRTKYL